MRGHIKPALAGTFAVVFALALFTFPLAPYAGAQDAAAPVEGDDPNLTLITLVVQNEPAPKVLDELSKLSGVTIITQPEDLWRDARYGQVPTVNVAAQKQAFWRVLLDVCQQAGLRIENYGGSENRGKITLGQGGRNPNATLPPQFMKDGILFVANSVQRSHNIDYTNPSQVNNSIHMQWRAYADPKVKIARYGNQLIFSEATDDKGNSLVLPGQDRRQVYFQRSYGSSHWFELSGPLKYVPEVGKMIKTLKAEARFEMVTKEEVWEIAEIANAAGQTKDFPGGKYTIQGFIPGEGGQYTLKVTADYTPQPSRSSSPSGNPYIDYNMVQSSIQVLDELGRELPSRGGRSGGGRNQRTFDFMYGVAASPGVDIPPQPARLVWRVPMEIKEVAVPVEMSDLPLP